MKIRTASSRSRTATGTTAIRRRGRTYVINKTNRRFKAPGLRSCAGRIGWPSSYPTARPPGFRVRRNRYGLREIAGMSAPIEAEGRSG